MDSKIVHDILLQTLGYATARTLKGVLEANASHANNLQVFVKLILLYLLLKCMGRGVAGKNCFGEMQVLKLTPGPGTSDSIQTIANQI